MSAVLLNSIGIIIGTFLGVLLRRTLANEMMLRVEIALGYCVIVLGMKMALEHQNYFVILAALVIGTIIGYLSRLSARIDQLAAWIQSKIVKDETNSKFALGFSTSSVLYCSGAMAIVGAIDAGVSSNYDVLHAKTIIDGILSVVFGALYGIGVAFSAIPVFLYEGAITIGSSKLIFLTQPEVLAEVKGTGGVLLLMIGVSLARIKQVNVADFLPSIPVLMIIMYFFRP